MLVEFSKGFSQTYFFVYNLEVLCKKLYFAADNFDCGNNQWH